MEPKGVRSGVGSNNMPGALIIDASGVCAGPGASADPGVDADPGGEADFGGGASRPFGTNNGAPEVRVVAGQLSDDTAAVMLT